MVGDAVWLAAGQQHPPAGHIHAEGAGAQPPDGGEVGVGPKGQFGVLPVAGEQLLGQRGPVERAMGFLTEHDDLPGVAAFPQPLGRRQPDNDDPPGAHRGASWVR